MKFTANILLVAFCAALVTDVKGFAPSHTIPTIHKLNNGVIAASHEERARCCGPLFVLSRVSVYILYLQKDMNGSKQYASRKRKRTQTSVSCLFGPGIPFFLSTEIGFLLLCEKCGLTFSYFLSPYFNIIFLFTKSFAS